MCGNTVSKFDHVVRNDMKAFENSLVKKPTILTFRSQTYNPFRNVVFSSTAAGEVLFMVL